MRNRILIYGIYFLVILGLNQRLFAQASFGNAPVLSGKAQISIITIGPYQPELYSSFGHTAIRVYDSTVNFDKAYNYGLFDTSEKNFYIKFAMGNMAYRLGTANYPLLRDFYINQDRYVIEQVINLDSVQRQQFFDFMEWNALPENMGYQYNYVYDNCSTRPRDVLDRVLGDDLVYDSAFLEKPRSFRQLMDLYLDGHPWGDLGIDICLGVQIDYIVSAKQTMFLPDYLMMGLDHASIKTDSSMIPAVTEKTLTYESNKHIPVRPAFTPQLVFGVLFLLVVMLTWNDWRKRRISSWFDILWLMLFGVIGLLLLFLWFGTSHLCKYNFNLIWANPLYLIFLVVLLVNRNIRNTWLPLIWGGVMLLFLLGWAWWPQQLHHSLIFICLIILIRSCYNFWYFTRGKTKRESPLEG